MMFGLFDEYHKDEEAQGLSHVRLQACQNIIHERTPLGWEAEWLSAHGTPAAVTPHSNAKR